MKKNLAEYKNLYEEILRGLRNMEGAQHIQKDRDSKVQERLRVEGEIAQCRSEILKWVDKKSLYVVSKRLSQIAIDFVDEASLRGRIPSPYNEDFVKGLIQSQVCVCGRPLPHQSDEWKSVAALLNKASNSTVLNRVVRARSCSQQFTREAESSPSELRRLQEKLSRLLSQRQTLELSIDELGKKIADLPLQEIADRERLGKGCWRWHWLTYGSTLKLVHGSPMISAHSETLNCPPKVH